MTIRTKTGAREKRHARWLERTMWQRALGELRRRLNGGPRIKVLSTDRLQDYIDGVAVEPKLLTESMNTLPRINHGPDAEPVSKETSEALHEIHEAVMRAFVPQSVNAERGTHGS